MAAVEDEPVGPELVLRLAEATQSLKLVVAGVSGHLETRVAEPWTNALECESLTDANAVDQELSLRIRIRRVFDLVLVVSPDDLQGVRDTGSHRFSRLPATTATSTPRAIS